MQFVGPRLTMDQLRDIASGKAESPVGIEWFSRIHRVDMEARSVYPDDTMIDIVAISDAPAKERDIREFGFPLPWLTYGTATEINRSGASIKLPLAQPAKWGWNAGAFSLNDPNRVRVVRPVVAAFALVIAATIGISVRTLASHAFPRANSRAGVIWLASAVLIAAAMLLALPTRSIESGSLMLGTSGISTGMTLGDVRGLRLNPKPMQEFASRLVAAVEHDTKKLALPYYPRWFETSPPFLLYYSNREWPIRISTWSLPFMSPVLSVRTCQEVDSAESPTWEIWSERGGVELVIWKRASHEAVKFRAPYTAIAGGALILFAPLVLWLMGRAVLTWMKSRRRNRVGACLACGYERQGVAA